MGQKKSHRDPKDQEVVGEDRGEICSRDKERDLARGLETKREKIMLSKNMIWKMISNKKSQKSAPIPSFQLLNREKNEPRQEILGRVGPKQSQIVKISGKDAVKGSSKGKNLIIWKFLSKLLRKRKKKEPQKIKGKWRRAWF